MTLITIYTDMIQCVRKKTRKKLPRNALGLELEIG